MQLASRLGLLAVLPSLVYDCMIVGDIVPHIVSSNYYLYILCREVEYHSLTSYWLQCQYLL